MLPSEFLTTELPGKSLYIIHRLDINNRVLLYSTGNYIQCPMISHNGKEYEKRGLPCGPVVKNLPVNEGDMGLIPGPGRFHMPGATKPKHHNY